MEILSARRRVKIEKRRPAAHRRRQGTPQGTHKQGKRRTHGLHRLPVLVALVALALVFAACDWPMFGFSTSHSRYNSGETTISVSNVSSLVMRFYATAGDKADSSPAVSDGVLYIGSDDHKLYAFDAGGHTDCTTGTPAVCAPLWTALTGGYLFSSPAVSSGVVYVGSTDGLLYAFDRGGHHELLGHAVDLQPTLDGQHGRGHRLLSRGVQR